MSDTQSQSNRHSSTEAPSETPEQFYERIMSEEPTDETLHAIIEKVAEAARQSSARVAELHHQRFEAIAAMKTKKSASAQ